MQRPDQTVRILLGEMARGVPAICIASKISLRRASASTGAGWSFDGQKTEVRPVSAFFRTLPEMRQPVAG
jgi:hypothetical protein